MFDNLFVLLFGLAILIFTRASSYLLQLSQLSKKTKVKSKKKKSRRVLSRSKLNKLDLEQIEKLLLEVQRKKKEKEEEIEEAEKEIHKARQEAKVENSEEGGSESSSEQSDPSKWKWEADSEEKPKSEKSPNLIQAFTEMVNGQDKGFCADAAKEFLNCCNQINPPKTKEEFQKLTSEFQKIFIDSATPLLTSFMEGKKTSEKSEKKQQSESSEQSDEDQKRINLDSIGDLLEFVLT